MFHLTVALLTGACALVWLLDVHVHFCDACGRHWTHTRLFSSGPMTGASRRAVSARRAHTCLCGAVQWWRASERRESAVDREGGVDGQVAEEEKEG